jgi:thiosulfate dehydrogenase
MKTLILGIVLGAALVAAGFYAYMVSGRAPVATSEAPMPLERFFAKAALHARLDRDAHVLPPLKPTPAVLLAGARVYHQDCATCHGVPGQPVPTIARGMFPKPPQLFSADEMVTDDAPGITFWKAKNGIRLTAMPGFHASLSDEQLWQVSMLLSHADKLPAEVRQALGAAPGGQDETK